MFGWIRTNGKLSFTPSPTLLLSVELVSVALASAKHKLLTVAVRAIEVPPLKVSGARPWLLGQCADICGRRDAP